MSLVDYYLWEIHRRERYLADQRVRYSDVRDAIRGAADFTDTNPSKEQKEAGNYRKGRFRWNGLEIAIENPKGSQRRGTDKGGKNWQVTMPHHYGYIKNHISEADGDHVDCFIGNSPESDRVYLVDQNKPDGEFDEHKAMLGFTSADTAESGYRSAYSGDWKGFGGITTMTVPEFKDWLESGDTSQPVSGA